LEYKNLKNNHPKLKYNIICNIYFFSSLDSAVNGGIVRGPTPCREFQEHETTLSRAAKADAHTTSLKGKFL